MKLGTKTRKNMAGNKLFSALFILSFLLPLPCFANPNAGANSAAAQMQPGAFVFSITHQRISLTANQANLHQVIGDIAETAGFILEIHADVEKTVTASFHSLALDEAIRRLAGNSGFEYTKEAGSKGYRLTRVVMAGSSDESVRLIQKGKVLNSGAPAAKPSPSMIQPDFITAKDASDTDAILFPTVSKKSEPIPQSVPHELIVQFKPGVSEAEIESLIAEAGASVKDRISELSYYVLSLPPHASVDQFSRSFGESGLTTTAEPNYIMALHAVPNDPYFSNQWALNRGPGPISGPDIGAIEAWDSTIGHPGVVIAIIDTGVDYTHEDLAANIWRNTNEIPGNGIDDDGNGYVDDVIGYDFVDAVNGADGEDFTGPDNDPMDGHGHGTHVAGIAAAVGNNGLGVSGLAWNSRIMAVRAGYQTKQWGAVIESDDAARAIVYAAQNGAHVINLSFGTPNKSSLVEAAVAYAAETGALICAAAGNMNTDQPFYPAALENSAVISVGASDIYDQKASFSNFGGWVDLFAPGYAVYSTYRQNRYRFMSGSSMSVAFVSGVAGLAWSINPDPTNVQVKDIILGTVDMPLQLQNMASTQGRVNAHRAISHAIGFGKQP